MLPESAKDALGVAFAPAARPMAPGCPVLPTATIVMANYNGASYLADALGSALAQSLRDIEVIVADDASTDDSADRAAAIAAIDPRVRLIRADANGGPAAARNLCLEAARGRWLAVVDNDDLMHPDRLSRLIAAAECDNADIVADDSLMFDGDTARSLGTCLSGKAAASAFWLDAADYVRANVLFGGSHALGYLKPLIRTSFLRQCGVRFDTTLRIAEDFDFVLRLLAHGARFRIYPSPLYFYRKHPQSISHRLSRQTLAPMLAAHERVRATMSARDGRLSAAMAARQTSLELALAFEDLVDALKRRDWRRALALAARRPRVAALLRKPLADRMRRLASKPPSKPPTIRRQVWVIARQHVLHADDAASGGLRDLCRVLRDHGCDVHLLCPSPGVPGRWPWLVLPQEMSVLQSVWLRGSLRIGRLLLTTRPGSVVRALTANLRGGTTQCGAVDRTWTREDALFVARHAAGLPDVVIAEDASLADGIPYTLRPDALSLVILHDASVVRPSEAARLTTVDAIVAFGDDAACIARARLPDQRVIVVPIARQSWGGSSTLAERCRPLLDLIASAAVGRAADSV